MNQFLGFHDMADGAPPALKPYLGQTVRRAWVLDKKEFYVWLQESNDLLMFHRVDVIGDPALSFTVGHSNPDADYSEVANRLREIHCDALIGMVFSGIYGDAVVFNEEFGAQLLRDYVRWVRGRVLESESPGG